MTHIHFLNKAKHREFLDEKRIDPITGEAILEGHEVVICAACKSAFFIESWEYLGGEHCQQTETLVQIPKTQKYHLQPRPIDYLAFGFENKSLLSNPSVPRLGDVKVVLGFFGVAICIVFLSIVASLLHPTAILLVVFGVLGAFAWFLNTFYGTREKEILIKSKNSYSLGINTRKQGITFSKKAKEETIYFSDILEISYSLQYHPNKELSSKQICLLRLDILTKEAKLIKRNAMLHRKDIPEWSDFLSKLPPSLRVINNK